MRRAGLIVIVYAFMLSYFGVGSIRNAVVLPGVPDSVRILAAFYGLSWAACCAGGVLMLAGRTGGVRIARMAAAASALVFTAGTALTAASWTGAGGMLFTVARPVYDIFLFTLLPLLAREQAADPLPRWTALLFVTAGAALPWMAYAVVRVVAAGPFILPRSPGIIIAAFMSLWSALPCFVLVLTARSWPAAGRRPAVLSGGGIGTAAAGLYAYSLIWSQGFNIFLLALLPPVVYAGQAAGIIIGSLLPSRSPGSSSAPAPPGNDRR